MSRGFVTIATGDENFYRIAANLLRSYRLHCADPLPFAIICEDENEYTGLFDQAVILDHPTRSYLDKLSLPAYVPYDETIFIDADCLAFADLNDFWDAFEGGDAFSAFGWDHSTDYPYAWFKKEDAGKFSAAITFIPDFNGGVYFLRKSPELEEFEKTCRYVLNHFDDFTFRQFTEPADEPVFALGMAVHGFRTAGERSLPVCFYPHTMHFQADLPSGTVRYDDIWRPDEGIMDGAYLVHWGSGNTRNPPYLVQTYQLDATIRGAAPSKVKNVVASARIVLQWGIPRIPRRLREVFGRE